MTPWFLSLSLMVSAPRAETAEACVPGIDIVVVLDESESIAKADPDYGRGQLVSQLNLWLSAQLLDRSSRDAGVYHRLGVIRAGADVHVEPGKALPFYEHDGDIHVPAWLDHRRIKGTASMEGAVTDVDELVASWAGYGGGGRGSEWLPALVGERGMLSEAFLGRAKPCTLRDRYVVVITDGEVMQSAGGYRGGTDDLRLAADHTWPGIVEAWGAELMLVLLEREQGRRSASDWAQIEIQRTLWGEMDPGAIVRPLGPSLDIGGVAAEIHRRIVKEAVAEQSAWAEETLGDGQSEYELELPAYSELSTVFVYGGAEGDKTPEWELEVDGARRLPSGQDGDGPSSGLMDRFVVKPSKPAGNTVTVKRGDGPVTEPWTVVAQAEWPAMDIELDPLRFDETDGGPLLRMLNGTLARVQRRDMVIFPVRLVDSLEGGTLFEDLEGPKPSIRALLLQDGGEFELEVLDAGALEEEGFLLASEYVGAVILDASEHDLDAGPAHVTVEWTFDRLPSEWTAGVAPELLSQKTLRARSLDISTQDTLTLELADGGSTVGGSRSGSSPDIVELDLLRDGKPAQLNGQKVDLRVRFQGEHGLQEGGVVSFTPVDGRTGRIRGRLPSEVPRTETRIFLDGVGEIDAGKVVHASLTLPSVLGQVSLLRWLLGLLGLVVLGAIAWWRGPRLLASRLRPRGSVTILDPLGMASWKPEAGSLQDCQGVNRWGRALRLGELSFEFGWQELLVRREGEKLVFTICDDGQESTELTLVLDRDECVDIPGYSGFRLDYRAQAPKEREAAPRDRGEE